MIPRRKSGIGISNMACMYELQVDAVLITQNPQLVMIPTVHLQNETEPDQVPVTLVSLSRDSAQLTKHTPVGFLQLYTDYNNFPNVIYMKIN